MRDLRRFGAGEEEIAAARLALAAGGPGEVAVWPENWDMVQAFLSVSTQWRVAAGLSRLVYLGLDYAGARAGIEAAGIALTPDLWAGLRVMEAAAVAALNGAKG